MATLQYVYLATVLAAAQATFTGPCNTYEAEKVNEGYYLYAYTDPVGLRTVGVGFNLEKSGARSRIASIGANYNAVKSGSQPLSDAQIQSLFWQDMESSVSVLQTLGLADHQLRGAPNAKIGFMEDKLKAMRNKTMLLIQQNIFLHKKSLQNERKSL